MDASIQKKLYPNAEAADRPLRSPVSPDVLHRARIKRLSRLRERLAHHDVAGILLYDPVNIRFALDIRAIQVWAMHNATRSALILSGGPAIAFEYRGMQDFVMGLPTVDEVRPITSWFFLAAGDRLPERVEAWADQIDAELRKHCGGNRRLAVDKLEPMGVFALQRRGIEIVEGQELTEMARLVKSEEELELMQWSIRVAEAGMYRMRDASLPGKTEQEIWAELHYENIRSGGEWMECRICVCGQRTNPWLQECSEYVCQEGEMLALDTDMIGPYGYCADISRSWTIGHTKMTPRQYDYYMTAREQIEHNCAIIRPGISFAEFNEKSWRIPEKYAANRYPVAFHGVGLADEWPSVPMHLDFERAHGGTFVENMVVSVESLIGEKDGPESVKLETQVVVRPHGIERMDTFPWEHD